MYLQCGNVREIESSKDGFGNFLNDQSVKTSSLFLLVLSI